MSDNDPQHRLNIPILPLRDVVVYPHMVIPLFVGRARSIQALEEAMQSGKQILLVAQKQADVDEPALEDIYRVGTLSTILQLLKLPDGTVKVLVEGGTRANLTATRGADFFSADITLVEDQLDVTTREAEVLKRSLQGVFLPQDRYDHICHSPLVVAHESTR